MNPESQEKQAPGGKPGRRKKYDEAFRRKALDLMRSSTNIAALARQLGVRRKWLYQWQDQAMGKGKTAPPAVPGGADEARLQQRIFALERELERTQRLTAQQALEIDFFKGALLRVEEKRRKREQTSGTPSTSKSGK